MKYNGHDVLDHRTAAELGADLDEAFNEAADHCVNDELAEDRETYGVLTINPDGRMVNGYISSATASFPVTPPRRDQYGREQPAGEGEYLNLTDALAAANVWLDNLGATGREVIEGRLLVLTDAQELAVYRKYEDNPDGAEHYDVFRSRVSYVDSYGAAMLQWCNMWLGIEKDGYTHS